MQNIQTFIKGEKCNIIISETSQRLWRYVTYVSILVTLLLLISFCSIKHAILLSFVLILDWTLHFAYAHELYLRTLHLFEDTSLLDVAQIQFVWQNQSTVVSSYIFNIYTCTWNQSNMAF